MKVFSRLWTVSFRWLRTSLVLVAVAAAAAAFFVFAAQPDARADGCTWQSCDGNDLTIGNGEDKCWQGRVCVWKDVDFQEGRHIKDVFPSVRFGNEAISQGFKDFGRLMRKTKFYGINDQVSSIVNNTSFSMCFYEHKKYAGGKLNVPPGAKISDLRSRTFDNGHGANDAISSFRKC